MRPRTWDLCDYTSSQWWLVGIMRENLMRVVFLPKVFHEHLCQTTSLAYKWPREKSDLQHNWHLVCICHIGLCMVFICSSLILHKFEASYRSLLSKNIKSLECQIYIYTVTSNALVFAFCHFPLLLETLM